MFEWLKEIILIIGICAIVFALIWAKHARPVLITVLAVGWLGLGLYSGYTCVAYYNSQSQVRGIVEVHDPYEDFNFQEYDLNNIVWYQNEDGSFSYEKVYKTATEFDGEEKYMLLVNDSPCSETLTANGRLNGVFKTRFRDIDNQIMSEVEFDINFAFYSSETVVRINLVNVTAENLGLVKEYVAVNGFNLRIIKSIY